MMHCPRNVLIPAFLLMSMAFAVGCALDRSDPRTVSEAAFRAILAKDYQQLRTLVGPAGNIPATQAWSQASFIHDNTAGDGIKGRWINGSISGYTLNELTLEDPQRPEYRPEKLVQINFALSGKSYVATFPIAHAASHWSPGTSPIGSDFFIRFEER